MNFKNQRFMTKGVGENVSPLFVLFMWGLIDNLSPPMDYLQVFNLSEKDGKQLIEHTQEEPEYRREYLIKTDAPIFCGKIFVIDGESHINEAGLYLMEHIDKEKIYSLYEKALEKAKLPLHRNNIRLMRMAFRYSDIETSSPKIELAGQISPAVDDTGEMRYMYENFDSFESKKEGYGIAFPVNDKCSGEFSPDIWYKFEQIKKRHQDYRTPMPFFAL